MRTFTKFLILFLLPFYVIGIEAQQRVVVIPIYEEGVAPWKGQWQTDVNYSRSDVVQEGGSSYISLLDHQSSLSNIPPEEGIWELLAASGATGLQGDKGDQGSMRIQGETGAQGPAGPQGIEGLKGERGLMGEQGLKGDRGDSVFIVDGDNIYSSNTGAVGIGVSPTKKLTVNG